MTRFSNDDLSKGLTALIHQVTADWSDLSDEAVAALILDGLGVVKRAAGVLSEVLTNEVRRVRRGEVRSIERSARRLVGGEGHERIDARARLLEASFVLPDGKFVTWGDATVEQHRERIVMLDKQRQGLSTTIGQHQSAIAECEAASVDRLNDIETGEDEEDGPSEADVA